MILTIREPLSWNLCHAGRTIGSEIKVWRDMVPDLSEEALDRDARVRWNSAGMCLVSKQLFRNNYSINNFPVRYSFRCPCKESCSPAISWKGVLCFSI